MYYLHWVHEHRTRIGSSLAPANVQGDGKVNNIAVNKLLIQKLVRQFAGGNK